MPQPDCNESMRLMRDDGGWLRYATAGDGEPVVFIHGFGLDAGMWDPQWQSFAQRHRVIRYDMRGYGGSSLPAGPYSHVDDLLAQHCRRRPHEQHGGPAGLQRAGAQVSQRLN